jgi:4-aminobutyrate aminotransferase-like enzyme
LAVLKAAAKGDRFKKGLDQLTGLHSCISEVRGRGLMLALELRRDCGIPLEELHDRLFEGGFLTGYNIAGNLLRFYPSLIIKDDSMDEMLEKLDSLLK